MPKKLWFIAIAILIASCVPKEKILYLQDLSKDGISSNTSTNYEPKIKADDLLRIVVSGKNMEAINDFNKMISPTLRTENSLGGQQQLFGYLVDEEGKIDFPILGTIDLSSMTISEATIYLKDRISDYISDPIFLDIRILNFKVTVLGEVNSPNTYQLESNRITLLQAIGLAGDLTIYGSRNDIIVLREVNGEKLSYSVDITSSDFIESEFYYLQQNDVVVVNPNNARIQSAGFNRNAPIFVSIASLLLSIIVIIERN
ncbi:MAG: polysaccharide biosynthesis/export family protein [Nonlabens sp.]